MNPRFETALVAITLGVSLTAGAALAGIVDSPLPELEAGKTTHHVYSVPSIIRSTGLGTFFGCTSTDTVPVQVGVEVFGPAGGAPANDPVATSLSVAPGASVIFGSAAVGISVSSNPGIPPMSKGSARILATSKKLACTAFVADLSNAPPTSAWQLTIIKKKTQKGDSRLPLFCRWGVVRITRRVNGPYFIGPSPAPAAPSPITPRTPPDATYGEGSDSEP